MIQLFKTAWRDLGRNRRRLFFSALALGMGLAVLLLIAAVIKGEMRNSMNAAIHLNSGHLPETTLTCWSTPHLDEQPAGLRAGMSVEVRFD